MIVFSATVGLLETSDLGNTAIDIASIPHRQLHQTLRNRLNHSQKSWPSGWKKKGNFRNDRRTEWLEENQRSLNDATRLDGFSWRKRLTQLDLGENGEIFVAVGNKIKSLC